jgi:S1-C subfamily serine protease
MRLAALAAAALLAPAVAGPVPRGPDVVTVRVVQPTGPPDLATGFVAGDGRVVTVAHVLGRTTGTITVAGRPATVVRIDRRSDLALLRVPGIRGQAPRLGGGDDTRVLDHPAPVVRRVTARVDGGAPRPALVLRAEVQAGQSGAPVVTAGGRVAGVVFARSSARANTAYAVDASTVGELVAVPDR